MSTANHKTFSVQQLTDICIDEVIPQINHKMLSQNVQSIGSFFMTNNIDSDKLFSIAPAELRNNLILHSSNNIKGGPANKLFRALKKRVHKEQIYDEDIVNELVNMGVATKYEIIFASKQTLNYKNINDVLDTINNMNNINFYNDYNKVVNKDKIKDIGYGPSPLLLHTKQLLQLAQLTNSDLLLYKIKEHDVLICGYCRLYLSMDVINYISRYYFSIYSYANMVKLAGNMSIKSMDWNSGYLLKPITHFPTVRIDIPVKKKIGKYYYEFVVKDIGESSHLAQVGWVDDKCKPNNNSPGIGVGDDDHSWAYDGGRQRKWHRGTSGRQSYGKYWKVNDVVGCGIYVKYDTRNIFDVIYYLNGQSLGIAWKNCKYEGNLYAAFTTQKQHCYGTMVFDKDNFKFMPDGYEPIFES